MFCVILYVEDDFLEKNYKTALILGTLYSLMSNVSTSDVNVLVN